ncbi:30S ribosomal protein S6 [Candidatus Saccharibacteria bacterium]|nr:30S ribosomal protein S6 [Candidatus Saccharibacteria bacterium]
MREYELTVLVHPDLEMNLEAATDKVKALIESNGGKITKENNEGKKKLAYQIKGQDFAVYYYYEVELPAPAKISSVLNITDEVIRYLLVAKDPRREKMLAKRQERKAQEASKEEE